MERLMFWWSSVYDGEAPADPWTVTGAGGTVTQGSSGGLTITGTNAVNACTRSLSAGDVAGTNRKTDRIEVQARVRGVDDAAGWSAASGHLLVLDDGERAIGVSIGAQLRLVHPVTGAVIATPETQPGGWTQATTYHLIKLGTEAWELWADGRLVVRWPYRGAPLAHLEQPGVAFGWLDASGSGTAVWSFVEVGVNAALPPQWQVDRFVAGMPSPVQSAWNVRWEATARAIVGVGHTTRDQMDRVADLQAGGVVEIQTVSADGTRDPTETGWEEVSNASLFSLVRERIRITQSPATHYLLYTLDDLPSVEASLYARVVVRVDQVVTEDSRGYAGPFVQLRNGHRRIGLWLLASRANADEFGWIVADANPGTALGNRGDRFHRVDPYRDHVVELYVLGRTRVLAFIDGRLAEDLPYDRFTEVVTEYDVRVGRMGADEVRCRVDFASIDVSVFMPDEARRPWFVQRLNERCLFVGGCERNDHLQAYRDHMPQVFAVRGTDDMLPDLRRLTCHESTRLVAAEESGDWVLEVTWPEITPTYIEASGSVFSTTVELHAGAPDWTPEQLVKLVRRFFVPTSQPGSSFSVALSSEVTDTGPPGVFEIERVDGFAVGDAVLLTTTTADTALITAQYDAARGRTDVGVRDFSPSEMHGALFSPSNATIVNMDTVSDKYPLQAYVQQDDPATSTVTGIRTPTFTPVVSGGFTCAGWFEVGRAHDGVAWAAFATQRGVGVGGFDLRWNAAGNLVATVYGAATSASTPALAVTGTVGTWQHLAIRYDTVTAKLSLWVNGVKEKEVAVGFAVVNPPLDRMGFGCLETGLNPWKGDLRAQYFWQRALTDDEIDDVFRNQRGREELVRDDATVAYLPSGVPGVSAMNVGPLEQTADTMQIASFGGSTWAKWTAWADGAGVIEVAGDIAVVGKSTAHANPHTAGATVTLVGGGASVDAWVEVFGIRSTDGLGVSERVHVVGTTPVATTTTWTDVLGALADATGTTTGGIAVKDTVSTLTEYAITSGSRAAGVVYFEPPLIAGPSYLSITADAATTDNVVFAGQPEGYGDYVELVTLAGTTPVETVHPVSPLVDGYATIRVIALGGLAAARTITIAGSFCHAEATVRVVSDDPADDMGVTVLGYTADDEPVLMRGTLNGTTEVDLGVSGCVRIVGAILDRTPAADVTYRLKGAADLAQAVNAEIVIGIATERGFGARPMQLDNVGAVRVVLSQAQSTVRRVGVIGYDENDELVGDIIALDGTDYVQGSVGFKRISGFFVGAVAPSKWVVFLGTAFRWATGRRALIEVPSLSDWTFSSSSLSPIQALDDLDATDVSLSAVDISGSYTTKQEATISDITGLVVTVEPSTTTVAVGDVLSLDVS